MRVSEPKVPESLPGAAVAQLAGHEAPIQSVTFSADGQYCWTGSVDRTVRMWSPSRLDPSFPPPKNLPGDDVSISDLPRALIMQVYSLTHAVADIAVDDQALICATGNTVTWVDVVTQTSQRRWRGHTARINAVAVMAPEVAVSASYDGTVRIWDMRSRSTAAIQVLKDAKDSVTDVQVDDACIRTSSVDGVVRTYDLRMGVVQCDDMGSPIMSMAQNKQDMAVSCLDGVIRLYNLHNALLKTTVSGYHVAGQYGLPCRLTASGDILSGSEDGRTVFYDSSRGNVRQCLLGHSKPTCAVATHPTDSSVAVTASFDGQAAVVWAHSPYYMKW